MKWDSKLEYHRWLFLSALVSNGSISNLRRQVEYEIIPKQVAIVPVRLKTKTAYREQVVERRAIYTADFVYDVLVDAEGTMRTVIEDTKSNATRSEADYVLRRKLMRLNGFPIVEVLEASQAITIPLLSYTDD